MSNHLFTSESVSEGHPDKVADQISDAILDNYLAFDENSKVACETLVTTGQVFLAGEIKSTSVVNVHKVVRDTISQIGYNKGEYCFDANNCGILNALHQQSADINRGVEKSNPKLQGAGDQGIMFGYATNETKEYMPLPLYLSNLLLVELSKIRKEGKQMTYLRPDSKSQVTVRYNKEQEAIEIDTIVLSTQHDEFHLPKNNSKSAIKNAELKMLEQIKKDVQTILLPKVLQQIPKKLHALFTANTKYVVNPTGKFVIGGPHGDTGLTGRKIIVDTYGGRGAHGGGAFSGKDPSKVDRSAAYAARHLAKNLVAGGYCDRVLIQISYAIGVAKPCNVFVDTYNTNNSKYSDEEIAELLFNKFDLSPYAIEKRLGLKNPIYQATASYGHFGRTPETKTLVFTDANQHQKRVRVKLFSWEELDLIDKLKSILK
jgi:S-adenosylmethionine synthetase